MRKHSDVLPKDRMCCRQRQLKNAASCTSPQASPTGDWLHAAGRHRGTGERVWREEGRVRLCRLHSAATQCSCMRHQLLWSSHLCFSLTPGPCCCHARPLFNRSRWPRQASPLQSFMPGVAMRTMSPSSLKAGTITSSPSSWRPRNVTSSP